jgi:hypothetical protein
MRKLYQEIATALKARKNCQMSGNSEWLEKWEDRLEALEKMLPSGSGFNSGEKLNIDESEPDKIVIDGSFHVMDECGMYDGYADYQIIITPSFVHGFTLRLVGSSRWPRRKAYDGLKDYITETYAEVLDQEIKKEGEK